MVEVDAFSTNFSLDGFGFDLGRCDPMRFQPQHQKPRTPLRLPLPTASEHLDDILASPPFSIFFIFAASLPVPVYGGGGPLATVSRGVVQRGAHVCALRGALVAALTSRIPQFVCRGVGGGLDMMIQAEHWT